MPVIDNERRIKQLVAAKLTKTTLNSRTNGGIEGDYEERVRFVLKIYEDILAKL